MTRRPRRTRGRVGDALLLVHRVEPVGVDPGRRRAGARSTRRAASTPPRPAADVPGGHRLGERDVGRRRSGRPACRRGGRGRTPRRSGPVDAERVLTGLRVVAEAGVELDLAAVGQVRDPAGDAQPAPRAAPGRVVVVAAGASPGRWGWPGLLRGLGADLVGGGDRADGEDERRGDPVGQTRPPTPARACRPSSRRRPRPSARCRARRRARPRPRTWSRDGDPREPRAPAAGRPAPSDDGPVVPWQPPSTLGATTNHAVGVERRARADRGRPTSPASGGPGPAGPTTWLSPVSACSTSTALPPSRSSVPQVS